MKNKARFWYAIVYLFATLMRVAPSFAGTKAGDINTGNARYYDNQFAGALEAYQDNILTWMIFFPKWPAVIFVPIGWFLLCIRVGIQIKQGFVSARPN